MAYLYVFIFMTTMSMCYVLLAYLVFVKLLQIPIEEITFGYPKAWKLHIGKVPFVIGWIPCFSSFKYTEEFRKSSSSLKWKMTQLVNLVINFSLWGTWLLIGQVGLSTLLDCLAVVFFQLSTDAFVAQHGAIDIWTVGAFLISIFWIGTLFQLLIPRIDDEEKQPWWANVILVGIVATLVLFVRLCIILWGK